MLARYHRAIGDDVYFVSGSDCHGTPVAIRAKQENKSPQETSDFYHDEFCQCFDKLGFSYDLYTKTSSDEHKNFVSDFHVKMYKGDFVYESDEPQAYCDNCKTVLVDRFVLGKCSICGETPLFKETKHLFVAVSKLEDKLKDFINNHPKWRKNAIAFSNRYINEGLWDRAITRELDWGIDVPQIGYEDKKIYIWAENVLGYLSASKVEADKRGESFQALWGENSKHYYVHGKDNIPFHTIILPSLLIANGIIKPFG